MASNHLRDTEVGDLDRSRPIHEQVLGSDVAVDDSAVVGALERVADRGYHQEGFPRVRRRERRS